MNKTIATICLSLCCLGSAYSSDWSTPIKTAIEQGNFAKASEIMQKLPKKVRVDNKRAIDSMQIIMSRIKRDFTLLPDEGKAQIIMRVPDFSSQQIDKCKADKQIEYMLIDGKEMWFKKAVRNLWLLNPDFATNNDKEGNARIKYRDEALSTKKDSNHCYNWQNVKIKFTLDVKANEVPAGKYISAWLPIPITSQRQRNFKLLSTSSVPQFSNGSAHNTVMLTQKAKKNSVTHFEIEFSYDVAAQYFDKDFILQNIKPYNIESEEYIKYTSTSLPHITVTDKYRDLAKDIVGKETNPLQQASMIYDWICKFPWAGARDYGTITNIPDYVIENKHGDCGQVALLYITLTRALGIPSRWESGWMLHPGEKNYHDWAETYFEGIGWVPTDVSFGRNKVNGVSEYYKTGTDIYRLATNIDIAKPLSPAKKHIRSETIDFQAGEVEWNGGNIEPTKWDSHLEIISINPIKY